MAAALFVNVLFVAGLGSDLFARIDTKIGIGAGTFLLASLYGYVSLAPALVLIAWSEWRGRSDWLFHALAGAGLAALFYARRNGAAMTDNLDGGFAGIGIAAGIVGASVYWLVCGRNAGALITRHAAVRPDDGPHA